MRKNVFTNLYSIDPNSYSCRICRAPMAVGQERPLYRIQFGKNRPTGVNFIKKFFKWITSTGVYFIKLLYSCISLNMGKSSVLTEIQKTIDRTFVLFSRKYVKFSNIYMKNSCISVKTGKSPVWRKHGITKLREYKSFIKLMLGVNVINIRKPSFRKKLVHFTREL